MTLSLGTDAQADKRKKKPVMAIYFIFMDVLSYLTK